jgi:hypothetical protein
LTAKHLTSVAFFDTTKQSTYDPPKRGKTPFRTPKSAILRPKAGIPTILTPEN